ncbi:FAD-dependent monooxygenase [Nonomuraea sp. NPDC055795]
MSSPSPACPPPAPTSTSPSASGRSPATSSTSARSSGSATSPPRIRPRRRPPQRWLAALRERHADDTPARDIVALLTPEDVAQPGPLENIPTVRTWHSGRAVLVGDAAHPTSPSSGQGASQATRKLTRTGPRAARRPDRGGRVRRL